MHDEIDEVNLSARAELPAELRAYALAELVLMARELDRAPAELVPLLQDYSTRRLIFQLAAEHGEIPTRRHGVVMA